MIKVGQPGHSYNIGGEMEISNIDLAKKICGILDNKYPRKNKKSYEQLIRFVPDRPGHDFRYSINCKKIRTDLGWRQTNKFQENLTKTVDWYYELFQQ